MRILIQVAGNAETRLRLQKYPIVPALVQQMERGAEVAEVVVLMGRMIVLLLKSTENQEYVSSSEGAMRVLKDLVQLAQVHITMAGERDADFHEVITACTQSYYLMSKTMWNLPKLVTARVPETCGEVVLRPDVSMRALLYASATILHLADPSGEEFDEREARSLSILNKCLHAPDARARQLALELVSALASLPHLHGRLFRAGLLQTLLELVDPRREAASTVVTMEALRLLSVYVRDPATARHVLSERDAVKKALKQLSKAGEGQESAMAKLVLEDIKAAKKAK
jgi:hypothetical protein